MRGLAGVGWVWELGIVAVVVTVSLVCRRRARPLASSLATALAFFGVAGGLAPRPQLVTFVLVAVTVGAWLSTATDRRPRWWLVPLGWVWACSHGMWFLGPGIGMVVLLGMLVDARREQRSLPRDRVARLVAVPVLAGAAALVTPVGPGLVLAPLEVAGYTQFVAEWGPSRLTSLPYSLTLAALATVAARWMASRRPVPATRIALWLLALLFTVLYARTVAIGALIAAPLLAEALDTLLPPRRSLSRRTMTVVTVASSVAALLVAMVTVPDRTAHVPASLMDALDGLPAGSVVYNDYAYGGWLFWSQPDLQPVVDGRTELFGVSYLRTYLASYAARPGWQTTVARSGATYALLPTDNPLGDALVHQLDWHVVATGDGARLLAAPASSS